MKYERTCLGCGQKGLKSDLYRLVRIDDGRIVYDESGRIAGRGAYVCSRDCLEHSLSIGKLSRALKCNVPKELFDDIDINW